MKRREFIFALGGAAAAWPLTARTQQPSKLPTSGEPTVSAITPEPIMKIAMGFMAAKHLF